jgi:4-hydroxy-2-oxoheptanedioate aldolase
MALSLGVRKPGGEAVRDPAMQQARSRVFAACKANRKFFLNSFAAGDVVDMIKEGVMIGPASRETAEIGRKYTKREMPW